MYRRIPCPVEIKKTGRVHIRKIGRGRKEIPIRFQRRERPVCIKKIGYGSEEIPIRCHWIKSQRPRPTYEPLISNDQPPGLPKPKFSSDDRPRRVNEVQERSVTGDDPQPIRFQPGATYIPQLTGDGPQTRSLIKFDKGSTYVRQLRPLISNDQHSRLPILTYPSIGKPGWIHEAKARRVTDDFSQTSPPISFYRVIRFHVGATYGPQLRPLIWNDQQSRPPNTLKPLISYDQSPGPRFWPMFKRLWYARSGRAYEIRVRVEPRVYEVEVRRVIRHITLPISKHPITWDDKTSHQASTPQHMPPDSKHDGAPLVYELSHLTSEQGRAANWSLGSPYQEVIRSNDTTQDRPKLSYSSRMARLEAVEDTHANIKFNQALQAALQQAGEIRSSTEKKASDTVWRHSAFPPLNLWDEPVSTLGASRSPISKKRFAAGLESRLYTTSAYSATVSPKPLERAEMFDIVPSNHEKLDIRGRLRVWQEEHKQSGPPLATQHGLDDMGKLTDVQNVITRPSSGDQVVDVSSVDDRNETESVNFFNGGGEVPEIYNNTRFLRPGDLVELPCLETPILAIFCRYIEDQAQFYTMRGKWVHRMNRNAEFVVPGFLASSELLPLLPHLPQTVVSNEDLDKLQLMNLAIPRSGIGAPLVESMLCFHRDADEAYKRFAHKLDNAYNVMAQMPSECVTTLEIAMKVLEMPDPSKISSATLWAVHRALQQDAIGFRRLEGRRATSSLFEIRSKEDVGVIMQVRLWLRQYQEAIVTEESTGNPIETVEKMAENPVPNFVKKARTIVVGSRKYRDVTHIGGIGPTSIKIEPAEFPCGNLAKAVPLVGFTSDEQIIIQFLMLWSVRTSLTQGTALDSLGPMILRAIGMYSEFVLDRPIGFALLQELGVISPWENRTAFDPRLLVNNPKGLDLSRQTHVYNTGWQPEDKMKHLRRDWGELEVFCIDGADTQVIDDGISLESIPHDASQSWVHVHVANPTAFISPENPLARYAAYLTESIYFPEWTYNMLPSRIVKARFSLANGRATITFSARINTAGEILETKITPGTIRNVRYFDPQTVHQVLVAEDEVPKTKFTVPDTKPAASSGNNREQPNEMQKATLRKLNELSEARRRKHQAAGGLRTGSFSADAQVSFGSLQGRAPSHNLSNARRFEDDPIISHQCANPKLADHFLAQFTWGSEMLVPTMMILAGEIAAIWCSQRRIPVPYRGTIRNPDLPSPQEYKKRFIEPEIARNGYAPGNKMKEYMLLLGRSLVSARPVRHAVIGTDGYLKVTSPLRRYGDMISHWQIEAAILHEASTGSSLIGSGCNSYLPFCPTLIDNMILRAFERERIITQAQNRTRRHWILQSLFRAHYFKEAILPEKFLILIDGTSHNGVGYGRVVDLLTEAEICQNETSKEKGGVRAGDWWECAIARVDVYWRRLTVFPLALIKRAERD